MKRRHQPRLADLKTRLTRLREASSWLSGHAAVGRDLRHMLVGVGSPTWRPAEDLSWRTWIESEGDEYARAVLVAIDEILEERAAGLELSDEPEEGS